MIGLPLAGFRVVNLGVNLPADAACARLVELGAAVTKVEPPDGDPMASASRELYEALTVRQEILRLDLKDHAGRTQLARLLDGADVLVTSSRPSALGRLGLAWPELERLHPRLVQVAIVGHPAPLQELPGHDLTYTARHGLLAPPGLPRTLLADLGGAERAVTAAAALLLAREHGGGERYTEVALEDSAAFFAIPYRSGITADGGLLGGGLPFYRLYEADGGWVAVAALEPRFRERLVAELGVDAPTEAAFAAAFRTKTAAEWEQWAQERDLPIAAVVDG